MRYVLIHLALALTGASAPGAAQAPTTQAPTTQAPARPAPKRPATAPSKRPTTARKPTTAARPANAPAVPATIDGLVAARLRELGIQTAPTISDPAFVRRAYLDAIGTLPTADEVIAFLADTGAAKRAQLVDRLLARDEYAEYWAMKWSDLLRVKSEYPINLWPNAVQAYHHWIRASLRANMPFDEFARTLLTASGSNFREPPANFWRAVQSRTPEALASAVALTFMGARAERWPARQRAELAVFFANVGYKPTGEWKEEIVFFDPEKAPAPQQATLPDGRVVAIPPGEDPRRVFAAWLTTAPNSYFARAIANRVWSWLMGHGIVDAPDDLRADNPPSNPALLALLEQELVAAHYDVKALFRLIMTSQTYQRASTGAVPPGAPAVANFAEYASRPLEAEVLIDAIDQITGATEEYSSQIPEPFTFIPEDRRTISLADGSITSAFLKTFGRSPRDLGLEAERDSKPTAGERLALLNSSQIQGKLDRSARLQELMRSGGTPQNVITSLYLTILARVPAEHELQAALAYAQTANVNRRAVVLDLAWALINTPEFLYRR